MIDLIEKHKCEIEEFCKQFGVKSLDTCGSVLDERRFKRYESDIDFVVEFEPMEATRHAKSYFGLLERLQDIFARNIDLIEIKAVNNPYLRDSINQNRSRIYAA